METNIIISGQISGNYTLKRVISGDCIVTRTMFNGLKLTFKTKKEAKKALWEGYKRLKQEDPTDAHLRYCAVGSLTYDASSANIQSKN